MTFIEVITLQGLPQDSIHSDSFEKYIIIYRFSNKKLPILKIQILLDTNPT